MTFSFKKALVTGGAGFIGSHLTEDLVAKGCRVTVLDNFSSGRRTNLNRVADDIDLIEGDIRDLQAVERAAQGCEVIFHLAAVVSVPQTVAQPLDSAMVNGQGTLHVLEAARRRRFRQPSSLPVRRPFTAMIPVCRSVRA